MTQNLTLVFLFFLLFSCSEEKVVKDQNDSGNDSTSTVVETIAETSNVKEVEGIEVLNSRFYIPVNAVGIVKAINKGKITSYVNGIFNFDYIYEGQTFKKGQLIGRVIDVDFDNRYKRSIASFEKSYISFLEGDVLSKDYYNLKPLALKSKIDNSKNESIQGRARQKGLYDQLVDLEILEREKYLRTIRAPKDLIITAIYAENGQNISKGTTVFDFIDQSEKVVEVSLFESESSFLKRDEKVEIKKHSIKESDLFTGTVIGIGQQINSNRFRKITIKLSENSELTDGEQVDVLININTGKDGIQIPNDAIVYRDQRPVVFKVENNLAIWQYVELGDRFGNFMEITKGIESGDKIITKGHYTLAHQASIKFNLAQ
jgi:membrane fusion protein, multidrug efflux system